MMLSTLNVCGFVAHLGQVVSGNEPVKPAVAWPLR
jgi:hypothetical protein